MSGEWRTGVGEGRGVRPWGGAERRGTYVARVTVLAVVGLVVALCLPSVGKQGAGDPTGASTGVPVRGVEDSR
ncbi:hypothetical protein SAMN04487981_108245 [Streptomyces sp. cf386]|nr:hypothetical protein SAMN04487981_108245 [Streptomyces sp. cf386]